MVELQEVTVSFRPRFVLKALSLSVPDGGSLALWGSNGAGKSTTFHAILDLIPYTGSIRIRGLDAHRDGAAVRKLIGWAPQDLAASDLSVERTVRFMAQIRQTPMTDVAAFLAPFGLETSRVTPVANLSGGQRKRLSLALATLGDPPVMLLDEPTANLDPAARQDVLRLLEGMRAKGKTLLLASHRLGDVARLADQVAVLEDGGLIRTTTAAGMVRRSAPKLRKAVREGEPQCADA